ncbi:Angiopoietin-1, partial [Ophiophagus hannah]
MTIFFWFVFLASLLKHINCTSPRRAPESNGRRYNRIQHGQCTYTFILPEQDGNCRESSSDQYNTNALQRDAPHIETDFSSQKLQRLEHVMENYTQWLQKRESVPQKSTRVTPNSTGVGLHLETAYLSLVRGGFHVKANARCDPKHLEGNRLSTSHLHKPAVALQGFRQE